MSNRPLKRDQKAFSSLESDSPVDLYWLHRHNREATEDNSVESTKGEKTTINDAFWDDFVIVAKAVKLMNREATIYDAFNFIREKMMGGWTLVEDSAFIKKIDEDIEREYQKEKRAGKWS